MSEGHIPAWKRIAIKKTSAENNGDDFISEDPLNVTTHLSTGYLTKKEKKRIIQGDSAKVATSKKVSKPGKKEKKRDKLPKEERLLKKNLVLKDQLRYLIDFYKKKISAELPEEIIALENVKANIVDGTATASNEPKDENAVVELWKFSKQKQNWLIKHFFNIEEIPSEYNEMLVSYFKDLQGRSRTDLLEKCLAQLKAWNAYAEEQEQKIKSIVEDSDKEKEPEVENEKKLKVVMKMLKNLQRKIKN
ncbi:hypothetical protein KAFR_0H03030 [Kazachstania africana CBS 2517]|uniref:WKF domain-containing protein n=1 Tax=Kazachstania africana (strain ATCC 22294 / BCRC 22015 / CBS 2517 / CECT 1963 / NBRC 1671 / NRRL Y-8276) TaxID=1071382 RepID=H2AZF7_KAZAF|nr:hypothetical protein KAFR_0H03030 [Kazachstania africana CBS 2517]CCF59713.1 hypothetical protein KAFR_0H03030 [Kazachstania africana CBS 2517]